MGRHCTPQAFHYNLTVMTGAAAHSTVTFRQPTTYSSVTREDLTNALAGEIFARERSFFFAGGRCYSPNEKGACSSGKRNNWEWPYSVWKHPGPFGTSKGKQRTIMPASSKKVRHSLLHPENRILRRLGDPEFQHCFSGDLNLLFR